MLFTELLAQLLRPVYGQAVVCPVPWVKADDIVVAFHIFPFLVFLIVEIGSHTGNSEIPAPAVEGRNAVFSRRRMPEKNLFAQEHLICQSFYLWVCLYN